MKFNWGFGIFAFYFGFVLLMIALVSFSFSLDVNLVADNYYEKEIKHQTEIDKAERYSKLSKPVIFSQSATNISIKFPPIADKNKITGNIFFSRDDNCKKDFYVSVSLDDSLSQNISTINFSKGLWHISIDWRINSITYLTEKNIMVY